MRIHTIIFILLILSFPVTKAQETQEGSYLQINELGYYDLEVIAGQFNYTLIDMTVVNSLLDESIDLDSAREQATLTNVILELELGRPIRITAKSVDIVHGLLIDELNIAFILEPPELGEDYGPSQTSIIDLPSVDITLRAFCHIYCGAGHSEMQFTLEVGEGFEYEDQQVDILGDWRILLLFGLFAGAIAFVIIIAVAKPPNFLKRYTDQ